MKNLNLLQTAYESNDIKIIKDNIRRFLLMNESERRDRFDIYNYVAKHIPYSSVLGVYHDNGFKIATNTHILIVKKEDYNQELEGKIISKDGEEIESKFVNYRSVIGQDNDYTFHPIDFELFNQIYKEYKTDKKLNKKGLFIVKFQDVYFNIELFNKLVIFAKECGIYNLGLRKINPREHGAKFTNNRGDEGVLMPVMCSDESECKVYKLS